MPIPPHFFTPLLYLIVEALNNERLCVITQYGDLNRVRSIRAYRIT